MLKTPREAESPELGETLTTRGRPRNLYKLWGDIDPSDSCPQINMNHENTAQRSNTNLPTLHSLSAFFSSLRKEILKMFIIFVVADNAISEGNQS